MPFSVSVSFLRRLTAGILGSQNSTKTAQRCRSCWKCIEEVRATKLLDSSYCPGKQFEFHSSEPPLQQLMKRDHVLDQCQLFITEISPKAGSSHIIPRHHSDDEILSISLPFFNHTIPGLAHQMIITNLITYGPGNPTAPFTVPSTDVCSCIGLVRWYINSDSQ